MQPQTEWQTGPDAWQAFTILHPELGYRAGKWQFHNFLRLFKSRLVRSDAIRLAKGRHWIAHVDRFCKVAFDCATGVEWEADMSGAIETGLHRHSLSHVPETRLNDNDHPARKGP